MAKNKTNKDTADAAAEAVEPEATVEATTPAETAEVAAPEAPVAEVPAVLEGLPEVSHNPTLLEWPTDPWGLTRDLKAAIVAAASRVQGALDKKRMVDEVFNIGRAHFEAKFTVDAKVRQDAIDAVVAASEAAEAPAEAPAQGELF